MFEILAVPAIAFVIIGALANDIHASLTSITLALLLIAYEIHHDG